jgi:hypothetical protein
MVSYNDISNTFTTEIIMITNLTGTAITETHLGTPITVAWTLPHTFAIAEVTSEAVVYTCPTDNPSMFRCNTMGTSLHITSTITQMTFSPTCNGLPITIALANVQVIGINGEHEIAYYGFGQ